MGSLGDSLNVWVCYDGRGMGRGACWWGVKRWRPRGSIMLFASIGLEMAAEIRFSWRINGRHRRPNEVVRSPGCWTRGRVAKLPSKDGATLESPDLKRSPHTRPQDRELSELIRSPHPAKVNIRSWSILFATCISHMHLLDLQKNEIC